MSDVLKALESIETRLMVIEALLRAKSGGGASASGANKVASDRNLDGQYGNPTVKFDPKDWNGSSYKRMAFSECSPEFLDVYAEALQYFADHPKAGREDKAKYDDMDAARARGWAKRIRAGWEPDAQPDGFATSNGALAPTGGYTNDDDIPF